MSFRIDKWLLFILVFGQGLRAIETGELDQTDSVQTEVPGSKQRVFETQTELTEDEKIASIV